MPADDASVPSSSSSLSSSSLGGNSLRGFFDAVDSGMRFLEREAAEAEAAAALDEARAHVALVGDGGITTTSAAATQPNSQNQQRRCSRRAPAPGWAWVADHLLRLVQQYSGGLSEPVMRTSLWQAWRQLVSSFFSSEFFSSSGFSSFVSQFFDLDLEKKTKAP